MGSRNQHKPRSETQNFKNKTNPQGDVPVEDIKKHLESKIVEGVKNLAKGLSVSTYAIIELGKELNVLEEQEEREASQAAAALSNEDDKEF